MTREIKFRAWDKVDKVMMDNVYMRRVNMDLIDFKRSCEGPRWTVNMECPDIILMQYTGLKDKDGKDIYEGDIVKSTSDIVTWKSNKPTGKKAINHYSIVYINKEARFATKKFTNDKHESFHLRQESIAKYYEIIGNIYESSNLLDK